MSQNDLVQPVAAAATSQVKLCPYDEAYFAAAVIRLQKLKYDNAFASLPKQVLQNILDTIAVCNDLDLPFDQLKKVLLGTIWKEQVPVLLRLALSPHGNAIPQSQHSHGETQTASPSRSQTRHGPFLGNVSDTPTAFHEGGGQHRQPQDSHGYCESSRRLVGCLGRP
jgi:hypothetical protein